MASRDITRRPLGLPSPHRLMRGWGGRTTCALVACVLGLAPQGAHASDTPSSLPAATMPASADKDESGLSSVEQMLVRRLEGPSFEIYTRAAAAGDLIRLNTSTAANAIRGRLQNHADIATQRAILLALADYPDPPRELATLILDMLDQADPSLAADLAGALGRYQDHLLQRDLAMLAENEQASLGKRRVAVLALGHHRTQANARLLMKLAESDANEMIRQSALASLATLWGSPEFGQDISRWRQWWQDHQRLTPQRWDALMLARMGQIAQSAQRQNRQMLDRLVEAQRATLRVTPSADRPALLVLMLDDPIEPIRQLAIEQIDQRSRSGELPDATVRQGLLMRLDDTSPAIRLSAARLLRNLRDEAGSRLRTAQVVAQKLATLEELNIEVLRAYLLILTDTPVAQAVDRQIDLLRNPQLRSDAAGALASAIDRGMVDAQNRMLLKAMVARLAPDDQPPEPRLIELLGRVGDEEDWKRIAQWLDSQDDRTRIAAARAWAQADRPLATLAPYAGVPSLLPIIIDAAYRRGQSMELLMELVRHKPAQEQMGQAWQAALVAMAGRIGPRQALSADGQLARRGEPLTLRTAFLGAAVEAMDAQPNSEGQPAPTPPAVAVDLYLHYARLLLASGSAESAWRQLAKADRHQESLPAGLQDRLAHLRLEVLVAGGDIDRAITQADHIIALAAADTRQDHTPRVKPVINLFIDWADRSIRARQYDQANRLLTYLRAQYLPMMADLQQQQLTTMENVVLQARMPATTQPATATSPTGLGGIEAVSTSPASTP